MTEEKQNGIMEAFSFRKGVVKVSGRWIRFGLETESAVKALLKGDSVSYVQENGNLKRIEKAQAKQPTAAPAAVAASAKTQSAAATPTNSSFQDRNKSIERQVALKAAVELAGLYGYKSTKECLDVAASFAAWIEAGSPGDVLFNGSAAAGRTANPSPSS